MEYNVIEIAETLEENTIAAGLSKKEAKKLASELADKGKNVVVDFYRKSDGQHGYLNRSGDHEITGKYW